MILLDRLVSLLPIFPVLFDRLRTDKCDLELKEKCMSTVATFIEFLGQDINPEIVQACISRFGGYLNGQLTRVSALKALAVVFG